MFEDFNARVFLWINASAAPNPGVLWAAQLIAGWLIYAVAAAMVLGWVRGGRDLRKAVFAAGVAAIAALAVNLAIASLWYHPRPFELGLGHQFLPHAPEASFPSDHATVLFAVAFSLLSAQAARGWRGVALLAALAVAWSRVYLGVHWPLDMAGSAAVALASVLVTGWGAGKTLGRVSDRAARLYRDLLDRAHLPDFIFPRRED